MCLVLAACKIAADDPQDSDFDPTDGASSRGRLYVGFLQLFNSIVFHRTHMLDMFE